MILDKPLPEPPPPPYITGMKSTDPPTPITMPEYLVQKLDSRARRDKTSRNIVVRRALTHAEFSGDLPILGPHRCGANANRKWAPTKFPSGKRKLVVSLRLTDRDLLRLKKLAAIHTCGNKSLAVRLACRKFLGLG